MIPARMKIFHLHGPGPPYIYGKTIEGLAGSNEVKEYLHAVALSEMMESIVALFRFSLSHWQCQKC